MSVDNQLTSPLSPRLATISATATSDARAAAVEDFWREVERSGAPLFERADTGDAGSWLVTFIWQDDGATDTVAGVHALGSRDLADSQLELLPGTDIWFRTYRAVAGVRTQYSLAINDSLAPFSLGEDASERIAAWRADPFGRETISFQRPAGPGIDIDVTMSVLAAPDAEAFAPPPEARSGTLTQHRFASATLDNERDIWVHQPAQTGAAQPDHLLVLFDGYHCTTVLDVPATLDHLYASGTTPPAATVMIGNVDRNLELPCHAPFASFVADELVPWMTDRFQIQHDPARTVVGGLSYGGLAAAYAGLQHPDVFGNVLSQSGSFWWGPDFLDATDIAGSGAQWEWLTHVYARSAPQSLRFYLEAGLLENQPLGNGQGPSLLASNRHFLDVLLAHGYEVDYDEFAGGHDYVWWRGRFAQGLHTLLGSR